MKFCNFFLLLFLLGPISGYAQGNFVIEGKFNSTTNITELYLIKSSFSSEPVDKIIKVPVKDGKFILTGKISEPYPATLSLTDDLKTNMDSKQFIMDDGKISIEIQDKLSSGIVKGSKAQDDISRYTNAQLPFVEKFNQLNQEAKQGFASDSLAKSYASRLFEAQTLFINFQKQFVKQNPEAFISLLILPDIAKFTQNYIEADQLFRSLSVRIQSTPRGNNTKESFSIEKKFSVGAQAPEFSQADTNKNKVSLSSLRGKYVLLDFWASWCGPCRQENPNVVKAYQAFKNKGFTVMGISLDRDKKNWLKAINADKLTWQHVSDLQFWNNEVALLYNVQSIPSNFLIDPQGKIVARNIIGEQLSEKLAELLNKN